MQSIYKVYKCKTCNREFILLTEDTELQKKAGRYLVCPYCSSRKITERKTTDDLRECMKERSYKRVGRAIREIR